jgi:hypothetical protein
MGCALVALVHPALGASTPFSTVLPTSFQSQLVELYSQNRCDEIVRRTGPRNINGLRPNVMAIVASCEPKWGDADKIFQRAETLLPTGDLILVLHAKYRTRKDPKSAAELWRKVLLIARNPAFVAMANEYFSGQYDFSKRPISLNAHTLFGSFMVGGGQESNPRPEDFVYRNTHGSAALYANGDVTWRHWSQWGSIAVDYKAADSTYFAETQFNSFTQDMKLPVALHVVPDKDVVFQPIGGYSYLGPKAYRSYYGLGILGVVYKGSYRQSVQGIIYQDQIYNHSELEAEAGSHYRFEYSWEFFPELGYISMLLGVEHASAGTGSIFNGSTGVYPFSHTDLDAKFRFERNFRFLTLGVAPQFAYRVDSEQSVFPEQNTGISVTKRRHDWLVGTEVSATIPIYQSTQLYAWYDFLGTFSNIGVNDYVNRTQTDNTVGIALKTTLSTY